MEEKKMKKYNVAILGASGAVGQQMLQVLEEYQIPVDTLQIGRAHV